jgi:hypothetical protein
MPVATPSRATAIQGLIRPRSIADRRRLGRPLQDQRPAAQAPAGQGLCRPHPPGQPQVPADCRPALRADDCRPARSGRPGHRGRAGGRGAGQHRRTGPARRARGGGLQLRLRRNRRAGPGAGACRGRLRTQPWRCAVRAQLPGLRQCLRPRLRHLQPVRRRRDRPRPGGLRHPVGRLWHRHCSAGAPARAGPGLLHQHRQPGRPGLQRTDGRGDRRPAHPCRRRLPGRAGRRRGVDPPGRSAATRWASHWC